MTQTTKAQTAKTKPKTAKPRPKIDRRILRTRDALGDAMMALLHEKRFDEITVQEVLDRAGVGRATFYAHYRDKDDLFLSDVEDFLEHVSGALKRQNANPKRLLPVCEFLTHIRDVREFHAALVKSDKLNEVWTLARGFFARSIEERLQAAGVKLDPASRSAQAHALAGSFFSLLDWWIDKGMKADPKEMDDLFHGMAWSGLQGR
ncbi:MAG TPA: TetR/AcrR family transcriptional regulator [Bryobacteraceae bacterium]|nr:TetR/AcrR family transcriptional regulator [Bryobacteraceae bacterium]